MYRPTGLTAGWLASFALVGLSACAPASPPVDALTLINEYVESHALDGEPVWPQITGDGEESYVSSVTFLEEQFAYSAFLGVPTGDGRVRSVRVCVGATPESAKSICGISGTLPEQVHETVENSFVVYIYGDDVDITFSPEIDRGLFVHDLPIRVMTGDG